MSHGEENLLMLIVISCQLIITVSTDFNSEDDSESDDEDLEEDLDEDSDPGDDSEDDFEEDLSEGLEEDFLEEAFEDGLERSEDFLVVVLSTTFSTHSPQSNPGSIV